MENVGIYEHHSSFWQRRTIIFFSSQEAEAEFKAAYPPPLFVFRFGVPKQLCGLLMCVIAMTVKATVADKSLRRALMMALLRTMLNTLTRQCGHGMRRRTGRVANMRGRRRGGSVPSMMQALQPLHGAPVVIRVVGHAANQMGVSVGVLQRVQRGSW